MGRSARVIAGAHVCLVLAACSRDSPVAEATRSVAQPMSGGQVDSADQAVGLLFSHTGTHVNESCTGSLIAPSVILTAGHCFDTNISSCGPVCTKTAGVACGPDSQTCGGP